MIVQPLFWYSFGIAAGCRYNGRTSLAVVSDGAITYTARMDAIRRSYSYHILTPGNITSSKDPDLFLAAIANLPTRSSG